MINPIDRQAARERVRLATPFPNICIDDFLDAAFAERVHQAFPTFEEATRLGRSFSAVNEKGKVQVTDPGKFAEPIAELNGLLASPEFLDLVSSIFEIPNLLADEHLLGGGMHQTGPRGHLDVHIDFNYNELVQLHRRLNILIYLNKDWKPEWGGNVELWDKEVKVCHHSFSPIFNRCVIFETSEISYHGVTAVRCPEGHSRKSFAAYYYTKEAPPGWTGHNHDTSFKARPNEILKGHVLMPLETAGRKMRAAVSGFRRKIKI